MTVAYNANIPDAPNNPSLDQPLMKINTNAVDTIISVDHVSFNVGSSTPGGTHKQVTFSSKNAGAAQTDPSSVLYTGSGTASTKADLFFKNENASFLLNCVKAFGVFTSVAVNGAVVPSNSYNVSSIVSSSLGTVYTITLATNATSGNNVAVFFSKDVDPAPTIGTITWTFVANVLTINSSTLSALPTKVSFVVLQA